MSGVTSLNTLTGAVGLTSGNPFIGIGKTANNVVATFTNTGIGSFSVQGQTPPDSLTTGAITLIPGAGISMATDSLANSLTITNTGGTSGGASITDGVATVECVSGGIQTTGTTSLLFSSPPSSGGTSGMNLVFQQNITGGGNINQTVRPRGTPTNQYLSLYGAIQGISSTYPTGDYPIVAYGGLWVSGRSYICGNIVSSPITSLNYVCVQGVAQSAIDPSIDTTSWSLVAGQISSTSIGNANGNVSVSSGGNIDTTGVNQTTTLSGSYLLTTNAVDGTVEFDNNNTAFKMGISGGTPPANGLYIDPNTIVFNSQPLNVGVQPSISAGSGTVACNPINGQVLITTASSGDGRFIVNTAGSGNGRIDFETTAPITFNISTSGNSYFQTTTPNGNLQVGGTTPPSAGLWTTATDILYNGQTLIPATPSLITGGSGGNVGTVSCDVTSGNISASTTGTAYYQTTTGTGNLKVGGTLAPTSGLWVNNTDVLFGTTSLVNPIRISASGSSAVCSAFEGVVLKSLSVEGAKGDVTVDCDTATTNCSYFNVRSIGSVIIDANNGQSIIIPDDGSGIQIQGGAGQTITLDPDGGITLTSSTPTNAGILRVGGAQIFSGLQVGVNDLTFNGTQIQVP